jgi:MIP family channel proteins
MDYLPKLGLEDFSGNALKNTLAACAAELIGTMFLNLVGCGSALNHGGDFVRIALCFGVTVATMAQSIGHISGCHINPAVTAGLLIGRKIGLIKAILYIVSQCIGAVIGTGLLLVFYPSTVTDQSPGYLGVTDLANTKTTATDGTVEIEYLINMGQGIGIEFFITFVLILVVFGSAADEHAAAATKGSAPLAIGLSITTCHLFAIPLTGSSMNPARSFGSAVIAGHWNNHLVY